MLFENREHGTILIAPEVVNTFAKFRQTERSIPEAGGYLMGELFGDQLVISVATVPGKGDLQRSTFFRRCKERGQNLLNRIWKSSGQTLVLAGEWHTHPERNPAPSDIDVREASNSFKKNEFPLGFMVVVIVSNAAIVNSWFGVQTLSGLIRIRRIGYQLWSDQRLR